MTPINKTVFITSDHHFGHANMCKFVLENGSKARPWDDVRDMDEAMIENWNRVVKPTDKVYHLGDVAIARRSLAILDQLHGEKILIRGNHDSFKLSDYVKYFKDIRAFHLLNGCMFTHAPMHTACLGKFGCNVHGHTHMNIMQRLSDTGGMERDPNYLNVCVEHTNYTPLTLDEVFGRIVAQGGTVGFCEKRGWYQQVSTEE